MVRTCNDFPSPDTQQGAIVVLPSKMRDHNKKTAFQKNLERRRSRINRLNLLPMFTDHPTGQKAGLPPLLSSDESSAEREEGNSDSSVVEVIPGAKPQDDDSDEETIDDHNFVVEDEPGSSQKVELPMEYSAHRSQPLVVAFKAVFQLFVHVALHPPHLRKETMKQLLGSACIQYRY